MGRRVFYMNPKKQRLKQELMLSYRDAMKAIDPALLEQARVAIAEAILTAREKKQMEGQSHVPIDRRKNIETIIKFLEIKSGNSAKKSEIRTLLSDLMS